MSDNQGITPKHLRNIGNLPIDNGTETPDSDIQNKSMHQNDIAPHISEVDQFLNTLKIHNKDIDACFNDALAVRHLLGLHTQAVLDDCLERIKDEVTKIHPEEMTLGTVMGAVREAIHTMKEGEKLGSSQDSATPIAQGHEADNSSEVANHG